MECAWCLELGVLHGSSATKKSQKVILSAEHHGPKPVHVHVIAYIYIYIHIYIHIFICTLSYICMYTYIHTYLHTYIHTYTRTHLPIYPSICLYLYLYIYGPRRAPPNPGSQGARPLGPRALQLCSQGAQGEGQLLESSILKAKPSQNKERTKGAFSVKCI